MTKTNELAYSKKILVMGGSRFFGYYLVQNMIDQGHQVTVLNRGNNEAKFNGAYESIVCDRNDYKKMEEYLAVSQWDIVYDQVCFDYEEAKKASEFFNGKVAKYIFTSSKSVYPANEYIKESDFDPKTYKFTDFVKTEDDYSEAKRQAEVGFAKHADFPVTMVRFPIVFGVNDYTGRFKFHVDRVKNSEPIYFPNIDAKMTFVEDREAALALGFLGNSDHVGPINVASPDSISLKDFMGLIEEAVGKKAQFLTELSEKDHSPYGIQKNWFMNCDLLKEIGLELSPVRDKLKESILEVVHSQ